MAKYVELTPEEIYKIWYRKLSPREINEIMKDEIVSCLNEGVELWEGFERISKFTAIEYYNNKACEVFGLDYKGRESLIMEISEFDDFEMFVIEVGAVSEDY